MRHQEPELHWVLKPGMWSQLEDSGFWLGLSPSIWVQSWYELQFHSQHPFLQIKKWKHREGKEFAQGHTVSGRTSREFSSEPSIRIDQGLLGLQHESVVIPIERKWQLLGRVRLCDPHEPYSSWSSPGQNIGVGSHSLLQEIFPT